MAAIELVSSFGAKRHHSFKNLLGGHVGSYHGARYLLKSLPNFWVLKLRARLVILILFLVSFPWIWSIFSPPITDTLPVSDASLYRAEPIHVEVLPLLFGDLKKEGLLRTNQKAIYITHANNEESIFFRDQTENDNEMEIIISSKDSKRQSSIPDDTIDFAFAPSFPTASEFIDRTLKLGGIMAFPLSQDLSIESIKKKSNYKIVYQRLFDETTMIAMRKTGQSETNPGTGRRLFGYAEEAKKAALENLEDVLLEPPRAASGKSNRYLKRTKYLPDLMGDSLESYPRRVFLDVGLPEKEGGSGSGWFGKNYPTRNKNFEMYKIETVTEEWSGKEVAQIGMSDWLEKNVREEEYVVMKGEAELVEEMVKSKAIRLVDELFLECKPHGQGGRGRGNRRRAYWECLALYGRLRDEGVAVHQWWG